MAWSALRASALAVCLAAVATLLPNSGRGEIYKWTDDHGVVNYTEHPPPKGRAQVVSPESTHITVYPAPKDGGGGRFARESGLSERVEQLERELATERRQREAGAATAAEREARRMERCRSERMVDCDAEIYETGYPTAIAYPRPPWWSGRPPLRPHPRPPWEPEREPRKPMGLLPQR